MTKLANIKKFYKDNEKTILVCSGVVAGVYVTTLHHLHIVDGMQLVNADVFDIPDRTEKVLRVTSKSGKIRDYIWNYADATKS